MSAEPLQYLREDAYVEPLVNKWYAWPYLIPPLTYSMYMTKTHRRLMASFVENSQLHILANQDRGLSGGGEFVDCTVEQIEDVKALLTSFDAQHGIHRELADAVKQLDAVVKCHKTGETIEPLYEQVPELLKGYVELFMDLYHQPSYRLIESLLYRSPYYNESMQSVSFGLLSRVTVRPFVLSTPRLPDANHLHVRRSFASPVWDSVFRAREQGATAAEVEGWFDGILTEGGLPRRELFTTAEPSARYEPLREGVRVRYIGHAGFLIETGNTSILVDPVVANRTESNAGDVISYSELPPKIDYICLTHSHSDHTNLETLLQLRYKTGKVIVPKNNGGSLADPSLKLLLKQLGFDVIDVDDLEELSLPDGRIVSLPFLGEHGDLNIRSKSAWFFELQGKKIFAGADSSNLEPHMYRHIHQLTGDLDILAIGMECVGAPYTWLYGALTTEPVPRKIRESRRLNGSGFEKASRMVETFHARQVLIYALGLEPWYGYFMGLDYRSDSEQIVQSGKLLEYCQEHGIDAERLCGKRTFLL